MARLLVRLLGWIACAMSPGSARSFGELLGLVWFHVVRIRRSTVIRQLRASFPEWPASRALDVARRLYRNLGRWAVEFLRLAGPPRTRAALVATVATEGAEAYDEHVAAGKGAIVATAHLGNWDLAACAQAAAGRKLTVLSRRLSNRGLDRLWMDRRRAFGLEIVDEDTKLETLAALVRRGGTIVLLIDQATPPERGGVPLEFLGRPAWTTRLPALLALRTGAPIFPVFVDSGADGRHVVRVEEPLVPREGPGTIAERAAELTRALDERLERRVREAPEQWLWLHRRWKDLSPASPTPRPARGSPGAAPPDRPGP
jgi:KDO2-lipid IV(A) lauroyltransferase